MIKSLAVVFLFATMCNSAFAFQSDWAETEGGAMRVVVSKNASGETQGFLELKLQAGWKTYWQEPGDGGIPPSLTSNGHAVELLFPAPERIVENGQSLNGYHHGVRFPFVWADTQSPVDTLAAFVGVCSDICIPFQADFALTPDNADMALVDQAFAGLPKPVLPGDASFEISRNGELLMFKGINDAYNAELFLAPEKGLYFGIPEGSGDTFTVKILKEKTPGIKVRYTLKTTNGAFSASFEMPK